MCMHIHTYMHVHIYAQPAANVSQMCTLMSKEHLYNAFNCTCTGAQNICCKVHATLTVKKCTYIYTYTHTHTHTYPQEYACAFMTPSKHAVQRLLRLTIYAQICIHIHIHMYIRAHVYIYIYTYIYIQIYMSVHIHAHIYTHTYNMYICTHASTSETTARQRLRRKPNWMNKHNQQQLITPSRPLDAPPRLQPLICTGAEPIHPVHGPPKLLATEATSRNEFKFQLFWPSIKNYTCIYMSLNTTLYVV